MAWITPPVFVPLQTVTASVMNQLSARLTDLFPYTTAGDLAYASASDALARLGIGLPGQSLFVNPAGNAPIWKGFDGAYVSRTTVQSIPAASPTTVSFNNEFFDTSNYWSIGDPTKLFIPSDGKYLVGGFVSWTVNNTGVRELRIQRLGLNSGPGDTRIALTAIITYTAIVSLYDLVSTDYLELSCFQNSGGPLDTQDTSTRAFIMKVGV